MKELIAFILPPATALAGMRVSRWILGQKFEALFGFGFRFLFGLAVGMLIFSQAVLAGALAGFNASFFLAWLALIWGGAEIVLLAMKFPAAWKPVKFQSGHLWLLLLLPLLCSWWVFGRLSTLEGTLEFDANAFWVFKAKILYLEQGKNLISVFHQTNLGYAHMDYPMLVTCLYTLDYGAVGGVDEFVNKVWPFWMMVALAIGILSFAQLWKKPHPLPIAVVTLIAFLPASIEFIRNEGGTIPMVFYTSLATLLIVHALIVDDDTIFAASILAFSGLIMTKFEGAVYAGLWFCVILPICWRRLWLKKALFGKALMVVVLYMLPYIALRLLKPVPHPDDTWLHVGLTSPKTALRNFPWLWFLSIFGLFFNGDFFHWTTNNNGGIQWNGHWSGLTALANERVNILPWMLLLLSGISLRKKGSRIIVLTLLLVIIVNMTILVLIMSGLPQLQNHPETIIAISIQATRYYYPCLIALLLGLMPIWFAERFISAATKPNQVAEKKSK